MRATESLTLGGAERAKMIKDDGLVVTWKVVFVDASEPSSTELLAVKAPPVQAPPMPVPPPKGRSPKVVDDKRSKRLHRQ
jgi:hypothetical protein